MLQNIICFPPFCCLLHFLSFTSKGIASSLTTFLTKILIASEILSPMDLHICSNCSFTSLSIRTEIVTFSLVIFAPPIFVVKLNIPNKVDYVIFVMFPMSSKKFIQSFGKFATYLFYIPYSHTISFNKKRSQKNNCRRKSKSPCSFLYSSSNSITLSNGTTTLIMSLLFNYQICFYLFYHHTK